MAINYHFSTSFLQQLCNDLHEPRVIVKAQKPRFEIVAYNDLFTQVSQTMCKDITGKSMAEIHVWESTNEEGAIQIYDALVETIQTKTMVHLPAVRYDLTAEDGTVTVSWWQAAYEPLLNMDGDVAYVLCTTHNITAQVANGDFGTTPDHAAVSANC